MCFVRSMIQYIHKSARSEAKEDPTVCLFVVLLVELEGSIFGSLR